MARKRLPRYVLTSAARWTLRLHPETLAALSPQCGLQRADLSRLLHGATFTRRRLPKVHVLASLLGLDPANAIKAVRQ